MCFVTSCRCELTPASQTGTLFLQYSCCCSPCCSLLYKEHKPGVRGWTLAVSSVHLLCNLASQGSWQMRFIPELAVTHKAEFHSNCSCPVLTSSIVTEEVMHFLCAVRTYLFYLCKEGAMTTAWIFRDLSASSLALDWNLVSLSLSSELQRLKIQGC